MIIENDIFFIVSREQIKNEKLVIKHMQSSIYLKDVVL